MSSDAPRYLQLCNDCQIEDVCKLIRFPPSTSDRLRHACHSLLGGRALPVLEWLRPAP